MVNKMAQGCGLSLAILYEKNKSNTGFKYVSAFKITVSLFRHNILDTAVFVRWSCVVWQVQISKDLCL